MSSPEPLFSLVVQCLSWHDENCLSIIVKFSKNHQRTQNPPNPQPPNRTDQGGKPESLLDSLHYLRHLVTHVHRIFPKIIENETSTFERNVQRNPTSPNDAQRNWRNVGSSTSDAASRVTNDAVLNLRQSGMFKSLFVSFFKIICGSVVWSQLWRCFPVTQEPNMDYFQPGSPNWFQVVFAFFVRSNCFGCVCVCMRVCACVHVL